MRKILERSYSEKNKRVLKGVLYNMPFDAVVARSVVKELKDMLVGGRVDKIYQPFHDEIILNIRSRGKNSKLLLTTNPSSPRINITKFSKENPINAPLFCMVLRKHLVGGRIIDISVDEFERIIQLEIESLTELGDLQKKKLIIEIMGKHSNIILLNHENKILDSIKHIDNETSKVREIMPARTYVLPPKQNKLSPLELSVDSLLNEMRENTIGKYLLDNIKGFSPYLIKNICNASGISYEDKVYDVKGIAFYLKLAIEKIRNNEFSPYIEYKDGYPFDFHCIDLGQDGLHKVDSINECIDLYYEYKDRINAINSRKANILKVVNTNINRCKKKIDLQKKELEEASNKDILKLYGELLIANVYRIPKDSSSIVLQNFYSNYEDVEIALNPKITPQENAQRYFKKYQKAKVTFSVKKEELKKSEDEYKYLDGVFHILESCDDLDELDEIKQELVDEGYITSTYSKYKKKNNKSISKPRKYVTEDGFVIVVGKNNTQNDMLTLRWADSRDIWLHAKNIPGSHVIIRKENKDIPNEIIKKAASLAAYFSKARDSSLVAVDYTDVKNIKKPKGAKPGMVVYYNNKTVYVKPSISI